MGFVIGLVIFVVIIWTIIIIAFKADLNSTSSVSRADNISLPSEMGNNSSSYTSSSKNFYNSEAAKYCCSKIVEGMLVEISFANNHYKEETISITYDFRVKSAEVRLCDEYRYYNSADWYYDFYNHRYPLLTAPEDREALAMAICNRVNAELKSRLPMEAKLSYSTERDDYEHDPSFTVSIKYTAPNPNYVEMKSW